MRERVYCLKLAYDGTRYRGWQRLPQAELTVQGKLENVLSRLFAQPVEVQGSGRTDAGVHALGQVVSFRAPERFHARLSAVEKTYVYRVWNSETPDVFERRWRVPFPQTLKLDEMRRAAAMLLGTHDFRAFCANKQLKKSSVRTLRRCEIERLGEEIRFTLTADGFLYHMVRILVGTLLEVGTGKRCPEELPALLAGKCRADAGETAPAKGLCLMEVRYE